MVEFDKLQALAQAVILEEANAVQSLLNRVNEDFFNACKYIMQCTGRVVVIGIGKSGHIGSKLAATLASTGTPAFFVHPGEASHGDLGMITDDDVVIAISYSGKTEELLSLLPEIKFKNIPIISMTGDSESPLARHASVNLDVNVDKEACPLNLTPTSSTTATLVMGDALAVSLLQMKNFTADDFARSHPGGMLGKRLLIHVSDLMHTGDALPLMKSTAKVKDALVEMTKKGFGSALIVDEQGVLISVFTDGDIRRALDAQIDIHSTPIAKAIKPGFTSINPEALATEALREMENRKITMLVIVDDDNIPQGLIHMHDILRSGLS